VFGPAHNLVEHLVAEGFTTELVLHPLNRPGETIRRSFGPGRPVREERRPAPAMLAEPLVNGRLVRRLDPAVVVAVDPLSYLGALLGSAGRRGRVRIYYSVDYAERRFANRLANIVYHRIDRLAARSADLVWSVSEAIADVRARQGVAAANRAVVPNAPPYDPRALIDWEEREPDSVAYVGMLDGLFDWQMLLEALALLGPSRPQLHVHLVGDGPDAAAIREEAAALGVSEMLHFHGLLAHHEALGLLARCRAGLVLYSERASWNAYRDSLKLREYLSRGVPVLTTANHPLAETVVTAGAGVAVESGAALAAALARLLEPEPGRAAAAAAAELARRSDRLATMRRALADPRIATTTGRAPSA
jgi:glycosyltransferase involved in cell wall biosynthesis